MLLKLHSNNAFMPHMTNIRKKQKKEKKTHLIHDKSRYQNNIFAMKKKKSKYFCYFISWFFPLLRSFFWPVCIIFHRTMFTAVHFIHNISLLLPSDALNNGNAEPFTKKVSISCAGELILLEFLLRFSCLFSMCLAFHNTQNCFGANKNRKDQNKTNNPQRTQDQAIANSFTVQHYCVGLFRSFFMVDISFHFSPV